MIGTVKRWATNRLRDPVGRFLRRHGLPEARRLAADHGRTVPRIAVLDTGVSPEFGTVADRASVLASKRFTGGSRGTHGTEVASIATGANAGDRTPPAEVLSGKVMSPGENAARGALAPAVRWAAANDADCIVIAGAGHPADREAEAAAVESATEQGSLVLASVGNADRDGAAFPARHPDVLAVGGTDTVGNRVSMPVVRAGSNWPADVCAWGLRVPSFRVAAGGDGGEPQRQQFSGTSAAVATVTHAAALVRRVAPDTSPATLRRLLVETGDSVDTDHPVGPRIDASAAVETALKRG